MLAFCLQESKWHLLLSPAPHIQHNAFRVAISLHVTSVSKATNVTTGVTRTFPHKVDSMNQTAEKHSSLAVAGLESVSSHLARFKLLWINGDVHGVRLAGNETHARAHEPGLLLCNTAASERGVAHGETLKGFSVCHTVPVIKYSHTSEIFQLTTSWAWMLDLTSLYSSINYYHVLIS